MGKAQIITTEGGECLVILPLAEYERLRELAEDAADLAESQAVMARIARGEEAAIPAEFALRIIEGETPLKVWREYRGLKLTELAAKAGFSHSYLSRLERGEKQPTIATLRKLAAALDVPPGNLMS